MEHFKVMYDSRVVIYERKMLIRLATGFFFLTFWSFKTTTGEQFCNANDVNNYISSTVANLIKPLRL